MIASVPLSTHQLAIGYPGPTDHVLLKDLNLSLHSGQLVCFMGPNGIGKSTLIRTLSGAQPPLAGQVIGAGNKTIAVVLTDKVSAGNMTVRDLVSYGRYPYLDWSISMKQEDINKIDASANQVRIGHLMDKPLYELSDGQLQMVMIARALAQDTPVLLLDEPTAHLDLNNRLEIMKLLRGLAKDTNKAILVSTHELDLALQTADLIWLATAQKSIRIGIPEDLVLDGTFDEVFQFKGFDLKTGKVQQEPYRKVGVQLNGEGHIYLWTKNALERNGYHLEKESLIKIEVKTGEEYSWIVSIGRGPKQNFISINDLLSFVLSNQ
ncbi:MAG TPA: ABC transporter ATP-binding protein [Cyclobacteriaceae bacterium]